MRFALYVALVALPATAFADDGGKTETPHAEAQSTEIIGGAASVAGKWPDAAALLYGGQQECTGTLIAPTLVLTAGHCIAGGRPGSVVLGALSETNPQGGETVKVINAYEYPSSQSSVDVGVLVLEKAAATAPRAIASGWAKFDIKNGANIQLVGFGTTDRDGNIDSTVLLEAPTTITDFNCTASAGCNYSARPDGELGAGGMGIDTCPGDSGGPLYLLTPYGNFLAGVTSRGYDDNTYYCSEGGIYGRADKVVDWVEMTTGLKVTHGPTPEAELITAVRGTPGETPITHNDPKSDSHTYAIVTPPQYGRAAVSDKGVVRVCPMDDVIGGDTVVVSVTDANDATRTVNITLGILIEDGDPDDSCDETAFGETGGGGCCDTSRSARGSIPLALIIGLLTLRRRRRSR